MGDSPQGPGETRNEGSRGQRKKACDNLQLCAGLEDGIEGATHSVGQLSLERVRERRGDEDKMEEKEEGEEEGGDGIK